MPVRRYKAAGRGAPDRTSIQLVPGLGRLRRSSAPACLPRCTAVRTRALCLQARLASLATPDPAHAHSWRLLVPVGLYYPQGSLKARLCVAGKEALYAFCERHSVPHKRLGKLLVATSEAQLPALGTLRAAAAANGVQLQPLSGAQARELEPAVRCSAALLSPTTGIVDSHRRGSRVAG